DRAGRSDGPPTWLRAVHRPSGGDTGHEGVPSRCKPSPWAGCVTASAGRARAACRGACPLVYVGTLYRAGPRGINGFAGTGEESDPTLRMRREEVFPLP